VYRNEGSCGRKRSAEGCPQTQQIVGVSRNDSEQPAVTLTDIGNLS